MMYIRITETTQDKGKLIPSTDNIYNYIKNKNKDYYKSVFYYDEKHFKTFNQKVIDKNGKETILGCAGIEDVVTNKLIFDLDNENLEQAQKDASKLCDRLIQYGLKEENLQICFSGKKGFSIEVDTDETFTPKELKSISHAIAGDLSSWDGKIYNANRILRIPLTKHQETGLYKIPITLDELRLETIEGIKKVASKPEEIDIVEISKFYKKAKLPKEILDFKQKAQLPERVSKKEITEVLDIDFSRKKSWMSKCKYSLQQGFFKEGSRHEVFVTLAATYASQGFPADIIYGMLKGVAKLQSEKNEVDSYEDSDLYRIAGDVTSPTWKGGTGTCRTTGWLRDYCQEHGFNCSEEPEEQTVVSTNEVFDLFTRYAQNIEKNIVKTGITSLDDNCKFMVGTSNGILAAPSVGKTSLALSILNNNSKDDINSIFFSYDMYHSLVYLKLIQKHTKLSQDKIFDIFKNNPKEMERIKAVLAEEYKNVSFCFKAGQSPEDIHKTILDTKQKTGKEIKLVVVDYNELVNTPYSDATASSSYVCQKLREIANVTETCVVSLFQPNKMSGPPNEEITSYRAAKGSSAIEQSLSLFLGLSRPGFDPRHPEMDKFLTISCIKNRMGGLFSLDLHWDGLTGGVRDLEDDERQELVDLKDENESRKQDKDGF